MPAGGVLNALNADELQAAAVAELAEDPKQLQEMMKILRDWIDKSPHLHSIRKDDAVLMTFLRGCKYSLERSKEKLDFFYSVRSNLPEWFDEWDPRQDYVQTILKAGVYLPLHGYDKKGRFVILMRNGQVDPNSMKLENSFKVSTMVTELAMVNNPQAIIKGFVIIQDMEGMGAAHAMQINPTIAKKAMTVWQDSQPIRPKAMHFLGMPTVMVSIFNMMQALQKEKMRERNHVHPKNSYEKLHEDVGTEVLPKEYGGTNGTVAELTEHWLAEMEKNRDWLIEQNKYKTDEKKRPGKPKLHSDIFGMEGSFRKLEID